MKAYSEPIGRRVLGGGFVCEAPSGLQTPTSRIVPVGSLERSRLQTSRGFLIPVALFILLGIGLLSFSLSTVSRSYLGQVQHMNRNQLVYNIAFSVYSKVMMRIREKPWQERFFRGTPFSERNQSLFEGTYDCFVIDAPGHEFQADIYVKAAAYGHEQTYLWRILYQDDLLDISNRVFNIFFSGIDPNFFPTGAQSSFAPELEKILKERKENLPKALDKARQIVSLPKVNDVAPILDARPPGAPPLPAPPIGTSQGGTPPPPPGVFTTTQERETVSPPLPVPLPADLVPVQGDVRIVGSGSDVRVAQSDGTVNIEPYPIVSGPIAGVLTVRIFNKDDSEVLFDENGNESPAQGKFPLILWNRVDGFGEYYSIVKGATDTASMVQKPGANGTIDWAPAAALLYKYNIKKGQRVSFEMETTDNRSKLSASSSAFP